MYSVSETEEDYLCVTSHPGIWIQNEILLWPPPGSDINRSEVIPPGPDWIPYKCRVLRENIETFEEALELEKMYSKHRDSSSFREHQEQQNLKRRHPVNHGDNSYSDLIDVNDMIREIDANADAGPTKNSKYHGDCKTGTQSKNAVSKASVKVAGATLKSNRKKELPFQKNYLKSGVLKTKPRVLSNVTKPKQSRYDNSLKSGSSGGISHKTINSTNKKANGTIPGTAHTKEQQTSEMRGKNMSLASENYRDTSTPFAAIINRHKHYIAENNAECVSVSKEKNSMVTNVSPKFSINDNFPKSTMHFGGLFNKKKANGTVPSATITKHQYLKQTGETSDNDFDIGNVDENFMSVPTPAVPQRTDRPFSRPHDNVQTFDPIPAVPQGTDRPISRPNDNIQSSIPTSAQEGYPTSAQEGSSFEERVLRELSNLKKSQESFESRIEKKIQTFINGQSTNMHSNRMGVQSNDRSRSHIPFQSRQPGRSQVRHRDPVPERYVDDFDDYEELDESFSLELKSNVEELEFNIRKNLEFKMLLKSRLNELGAKSYKKCIRLKMKYLFSDPVLECYTLCGTEEKGAFKKFKAINNLLLQSVRDRHPNTHKDEYKDYMMIWLKHAKTRQRKVTYSYPNRKNANREDDSDSDDENF